MKTLVSTAGSGQVASPEGTDLLLPGAMAGPWRVEHELGRGGMGAVYAVVHDEIGKRAALKVVHRRLMPSFNSDRMLLEAKVVNQVGHPNIVDIFEAGTLADGRPYIVMERLCGQSLSARADGGKLLPDAVIAILLQICDALIAAHAAGIVHRDLKLDNVFLSDSADDPSTPRVKLLDWGIAKVIHHEVKHTIEGQLMGTPQYLAPEQARGQAVSPQTDVYSLGVMAYELFLEQLPFEAETAAEVMAMHLRAIPPPPSELWPDVPPELEQLLLAMLAKSPEQRPTMAEVAQRLDVVRGELQRRCRLHSGPRLPWPTPGVRCTPSRPGRASSATGIAATESFAWRSETRRWQYAIGGLALALSGLMLVISRAGDRAARAATTTELIAPVAAVREAAMPGAGRDDDDATPDPAALDRDDDAADPAAADRDDAAGASLPTPAGGAQIRHALATVPVPARPAVLRQVRPERSPSHVAPRIAPRVEPAPSPPAVPRRGAKADPDGTLDVYQ